MRIRKKKIEEPEIILEPEPELESEPEVDPGPQPGDRYAGYVVFASDGRHYPFENDTVIRAFPLTWDAEREAYFHAHQDDPLHNHRYHVQFATLDPGGEPG